MHASRVRRLARALDKAGLDGAILAPGPNMRYLTGVKSVMLERPFMMFVSHDGAVEMVAPYVESGPYKELGLSVHEWTDSQGPGKAIGEAASEAGMKGRWGVDGKTPFLYLDRLTKVAKPELVDGEPVLQGVREVKDSAEVALMKKSGRILSDAFGEFPGLMEVGMTEAELARKAADMIVSKGADMLEDLLVQSGPNTAHPHGLATGRKIRRNEGVIMDISSVYGGYVTDITRTFCLGRSDELERVYALVLDAQERAIRAGGEGVEVGRVDSAARGALRKAGLGENFTHRTGHGLGLEVHEAPYIVEGGREGLERNMFYTVEPGAYMPGRFGVRIEDDVQVTGKGVVSITDPPKEYGWWR
jgi:Xaa-Pro aminopeptidase